MLTVIATEEEMRKGIPSDEEELQFGYDEWLQEHWPFLNSMYLLVMVLIWHNVERVSERLKPVLAYIRKLTLTPTKMAQTDVDAVFAAGWDERAVYDAVQVCCASWKDSASRQDPISLRWRGS
jgi:hypothetical protein